MNTRRTFLKAFSALPLRGVQGAAMPPNIVLILTDDQGYADVGVYGARGFRTPRIDRMAAEGVRLTNFYAAAAICTPSRAAILTGCYPVRIGLTKVVAQKSTFGIADGERLLSEMLRARGYRTAIFGKWHLGNQKKFLPLQHGFDEFVGTPGSNDLGSNMDLEARRRGEAGVEWIAGNEVVATNPDQSQFTKRYTGLAVDFIRRNRDRPFFLYVAHNMPHTPIFASEKFRGRTKRGLYGDVIEELDWSVGEILDAVHREGLDERTLVIFTSDNGPWLIFGDHGGSADPLRGGKKQSFEGGMRVPAIFRWPGRIPAGRHCSEIVTGIDIMPTVARLTGGDLPRHAIDGKDVWPLLAGERGAKSPHEAFFFYYEDELRGVRSGRWKLQLPHRDAHAPDPERIGRGGVRGEVKPVERPLALYDLEVDPGETANLAARHPDVVARLKRLADGARKELGDAITGATGSGVRPPGRA